MSDDPRVVLLDIEGTIAPIAFVHDVLFPFARRRLRHFLQQNWDEPGVRSARRQIAIDAGGAELPLTPLVEHLQQLIDADAKTTGLKLLQGMIWEGGFHSGELRAPLFADVPAALRRWTDSGRRACIYSSGSVAAQRLFISHTDHGDLSQHISGYFDTTIGPKRAAASYAAIAQRLETPPARVLFVSDVVEELDAAASAGLRSRLALRPGNPPQPASKHDTLADFDGLLPD